MIELLKQHCFFRDKTIDSCIYLEQQGYCNANYVIVCGGRKYIVRKLLRTDRDRNFEYKVQQLAFLENITAEPLLFDEENGLMVFAFLEGVHKDVLEADDVKVLADTLIKLHSIHVEKQPVEIKIQNKTNKVLQALEHIGHYPGEYVLCHNDLNAKNIFFTHEAKLIDFEYAGVNDIYFDLASVCIEFKLSELLQRILLETYFNSAYTLEKLEAYKVIYKALVEEWFDTML